MQSYENDQTFKVHNYINQTSSAQIPETTNKQFVQTKFLRKIPPKKTS